MKHTMLCLPFLLVFAIAACTNSRNPETHSPKIDSTVNQKNIMKNVVSIVELPTVDFPRAISFYQTILGIHIDQTSMAGTQMGVFPGDNNTVSLVLIKGEGYKPSADGPVVYLNGGEDLQIVLAKVESNGGKILVPKTEISPEMGFYAMFLDSEGNKLGLHSTH